MNCSCSGILQTAGPQCLEEHSGEDVALFPSRERLEVCESWQDAQLSCLLRKGAVTRDQVSFYTVGRVGCVSLALGLPHPTPWYPPTCPTFPLLSPAWQSISRLPAGTGALSWDKNSHVCLPMDKGWQKVKTSPVQLCWAHHVCSGMKLQDAGDEAHEPGHHSCSTPN